jgi:hypothetical protein
VTDAAIRYERFGGDAVQVTPSGAASCLSRGDAVVRASVGEVTSLVTVHCRPVWKIYATPARFDFLTGDAPQAIRVEAVDERAVLGRVKRGVGCVKKRVRLGPEEQELHRA